MVNWSFGFWSLLMKWSRQKQNLRLKGKRFTTYIPDKYDKIKFVYSPFIFRRQLCNPHFFQNCCHFCSLRFDFSENDNTFERNEDCATFFLKWTEFNKISENFYDKILILPVMFVCANWTAFNASKRCVTPSFVVPMNSRINDGNDSVKSSVREERKYVRIIPLFYQNA